MEYLNIKEFSKIWGISERRIMKLCNEGRIPGSYKKGRVWNIPSNSAKPLDMRKRSSSYIDEAKKIIILNCPSKLKGFLEEIINNKGYEIEYKNDVNKIESKYYYGAVIFDRENNEKSNIKKSEQIENKIGARTKEKTSINKGENHIDTILDILSTRLNSESSIVLISKQKYSTPLKIQEEYGFRINTLSTKIEENENNVLDCSSFAVDICNLLFNFKYVNNAVIEADYEIIKYNKDFKTKKYMTGEYYKILNYIYNNLNNTDTLYLISPMMETEWTDSALEMNFRIINMNALSRGVKIERIFVFEKEKMNLYKNNKTLEIFLNSDMETLFVDKNVLSEKLIKEIDSGIGFINNKVLIYDLPDSGKYRAYLSKNSDDLNKYLKTYKEVKKYAVKFKEVLK